MPKDNIERAIKRASDKSQGDYKEVLFEGYAPHGIAILVETATDNNNRTVANIRSYFNKCDGNLGTSGSVEFMFDHTCNFRINGEGLDPEELESICKPVVDEDIDYVKGNRLIHKSAWVIIPRVRFLGNSILSILTKIASGYWGISDTQSGYTAISNNALNSVPLYDIYKRYGMPNDLLVKLNIAFCTIREVKIKPIYGVGEKSKLNIIKVSIPILLLLIRSFFTRLQTKYLYRSFHPLYLLYWSAFIIGIINSYFIYQLIVNFFDPNTKTPTDYLIIFIFLTISGFQSLLFAMWMDIQDNERLSK